MKELIKRAGWSVFFMIMAVSCLDEPDCFSLNNNIIQITFKRLAGNAADSILVLGISAEDSDSIFYRNTIFTNGKIILPLNYLADGTTYTIRQMHRTDVLTLQYRSKVQFVSEECGERFVVSGLSIDSHTFDSVRLVSDIPSRALVSAANNIEIYRCPQKNSLRIAFKKTEGSETVSDVVSINGITVDYPQEITTPNASVSYMNIPLNTAADETTISFEMESGTKTITLSYTRMQEELFPGCGNQTSISDIQLVNTDFGSVNIVNNNLQDPPAINLEVFQ